MNNMLLDQFQDQVNDLLIRHKDLMDTITKFQESNAKVNRAIVKSATRCGCIKINSKKQQLPKNEIPLQNIKEFMNSNVTGELCDTCRDKIEEELGINLFYLVAVCNTLGLNIYDIIIKEMKNLSTLGVFNMM